MKALTNTQKRILTAASKSPKLPIEEHMGRIKSPAVRRQIAYSLLCSGYVTEDCDYHYVTDEGLAALKGKAPKEKKQAKTAKPAKKEKQKKATAKTASTSKAKKPAAADAKKPAAAPAPKKEAAPAADKKSDKPAKGRQLLIDMLSRKEGATQQQMVDATGWQKGAISGTMSKIKKLLAPRNQGITSAKDAGGKLVYRIAEQKAQQPVAKSA